MKNENGRELRTEEEVSRAFSGRLEKTFRIGEENEDFNPVTEGEVETWLRRRENDLRTKRTIHFRGFG